MVFVENVGGNANDVVNDDLLASHLEALENWKEYSSRSEDDDMYDNDNDNDNDDYLVNVEVTDDMMHDRSGRRL